MSCTFGTGAPRGVAGAPEELPKCLVIWGQSGVGTGRYSRTNAIYASGGKIIIIDPASRLLTWDRKRMSGKWSDEIAAMRLKPKPQSDGCLALGMVKTIIEEELYDKEFVEKWTHGFEELKAHVKTFTYEDVEKHTWVPKEQFQAAVRMMMANKPFALTLGNALEMSCTTVQDLRAMNFISALGGQVRPPPPEFPERSFYPPGRFFLLSRIGRKYDKSATWNLPWANKCAYQPYTSLAKTILSGKPAPVKMMIVLIAAPLLTSFNAKEQYDALMALDCLVVAELFMAPTAMLADYVLPAAHLMEFAGAAYWGGMLKTFPRAQKAPGEAWPDEKWLIALGRRLGYEEYFPWDPWKGEEWRGVHDYWIQPTGKTREEHAKWQFEEQARKAKEPPPPPPKEGERFNTKTGKIEFTSETLKEMGYSALPLWQELLLSTAPYPTTEAYPLVMYNPKDYPYIGSMYRSVPGLRDIVRYPRVGLNPETAKKYGLEDGQWAWIESNMGRIRQMVKYDLSLDPRMVDVAFGWWYPEQASNLHGWSDSNCSILIPSDPIEVITGSGPAHGIPVKVYPAW